MRIVVLGAGTVGTSIAELLCQNRHSVTVVDSNPEYTRRVNDELDVKVVTGSAAQSSVLFQAGVLEADLCLAVTGSDEINLVSASMAKAMGARRTVARVYAPVFRDLSTFDYQRHFNIDRLLSLEHLSALELAKGIRHPGSTALENFAGGELEVQEFVISEKTSFTGVQLKQVELPKEVRVGSILRNGKMWIAGAEDALEVGDRITLIGSRSDIDDVKDKFQDDPAPKKGIVIAGGGETGFHLASMLEGLHFAVMIMESNRARCDTLAAKLKHTTVVHSDATRRTTLEEEHVGSADVFVACTGDDENNILACIEAQDIGTKLTMSIVSRPDYANIVGKLGIDLAISPREVMAKQVLGFLNTGPVISRTALAGGSISIFEIEVLPDAPATEHVLANLRLPPQCLIASVMREQYARVPGADDHLRPGDLVVALVADEAVEETLAMFSTNSR